MSDPAYSVTLQKLLSDGWVMISEGESGAQLKHPRVMRTSTKIVIAVGIVGVFVYGLGLLLLVLGLVDYYALTKERTYFVRKDAPALPAPEKKSSVVYWLLGVLLAIIALAIGAAMLAPRA